ncbi:fibulin-1-like isoform X2 [Watersipora subatra]|uniref:fibulin-1-like isoform X2 n=1 Tax=Watersipora subatra TaxID=2589382 RepID=UPI00355C1A30
MRLLCTSYVLFALAVFVLADLSVDLVEQCCVKGSEWASATRVACPAIPDQLLEEKNLNKDDMETCKSLANICCMQTYRHEQCEIGRDISLETSTCSNIKVVRGNTEVYTHQRECCQCCELGSLAASTSKNCDLFQLSGAICNRSSDCCDAFYSCCNRSSSGVESTTQPPIITTTAAPDVTPVHSPDGICIRFSSALCEHFCHDAPDRPNKFRCSCRGGFELAANQRNCIESEREPTCETDDRCSANAECYMRLGTPVCRCVSRGYQLSGSYQCQDVNECSQGLHNCTSSQECVNTDGAFQCNDPVCRSSERFNSSAGKCVSDRPTGSGSCSAGYIYVHDRGVCVTARPQDSTCPTGYAHNVIDNLCEDIDECATGWNDCSDAQRCENTIGWYSCKRRISCGTGYSLQGSSQTCIDINECDLGTDNCGPAFTCLNVAGSFRCEYKTCPPGQRLNIATGECEGAASCERGFVWAEYTRRCEDVNECLNETPCLPSESCVNTEGSYRCVGSSKPTCYNGFALNIEGTACEDINECERGIHNCLSRGHCTNTQGSFRCRCDNGYALNSVSNTCQDINECSRAVGQFCNPTNSQCVNTPGSFYCKCKEGFEAIANGRACKDKNECSIPNICEHTCHNVWGSFQCRCRAGYRLAEDKRSCTDINECELAPSRGRVCNGFCENTPGSFRCTCPAGYRLSDSGRECIDIDECSEGLAGCSGVDSVCTNTRGSFKCQIVECPRYFTTATDSSSRFNQDGVICYKNCPITPSTSPECFLNTTSIISYHFLQLPTITDSEVLPMDLFTLTSSSNIFYPNVIFRISSGNWSGKFKLIRKDLYTGLLQLIEPVEGPKEFVLHLTMEVSNLNNAVVSSQRAIVNIVVSQQE